MVSDREEKEPYSEFYWKPNPLGWRWDQSDIWEFLKISFLNLKGLINERNKFLVINSYMKIDKKAYGFNRGIVDMLMYNRLKNT